MNVVWVRYVDFRNASMGLRIPGPDGVLDRANLNRVVLMRDAEGVLGEQMETMFGEGQPVNSTLMTSQAGLLSART